MAHTYAHTHTHIHSGSPPLGLQAAPAVPLLGFLPQNMNRRRFPRITCGCRCASQVALAGSSRTLADRARSRSVFGFGAPICISRSPHDSISEPRGCISRSPHTVASASRHTRLHSTARHATTRQNTTHHDTAQHDTTQHTTPLAHHSAGILVPGTCRARSAAKPFSFASACQLLYQ